MSLQKWSDDIWIKRLADRPALSEDLEVVTERYRAEMSPPHLMLDMSQVTALGSANLSQMMELHKHARVHGRRMKIASPGNAVWSVFMIASLDGFFEFAEDPAAGLADLQIGG